MPANVQHPEDSIFTIVDHTLIKKIIAKPKWQLNDIADALQHKHSISAIISVLQQYITLEEIKEKLNDYLIERSDSMSSKKQTSAKTSTTTKTVDSSTKTQSQKSQQKAPQPTPPVQQQNKETLTREQFFQAVRNIAKEDNVTISVNIDFGDGCMFIWPPKGRN